MLLHCAGFIKNASALAATVVLLEGKAGLTAKLARGSGDQQMLLLAP